VPFGLVISREENDSAVCPGVPSYGPVASQELHLPEHFALASSPRKLGLHLVSSTRMR
jgi:hypothetical protein